MTQARELRFTVIGLPAPKGSTKAFIVKGKNGPRAVTTGDNRNTKGWQQTIQNCAALELLRPQHFEFFIQEGAIACELTFFLPRPKSLLVKSKAFRTIPHTKKPDLDKLARAAKDALSRVVWSDDAQVTDLIAKKRYCAPGEAPHVDIVVRRAALEDLFYG